jgi:hypothetical protein
MAEAEALWAVVGFIVLTSIVMPGATAAGAMRWLARRRRAPRSRAEPHHGAEAAARRTACYARWCSRKNRSIAREASGPRGSV